MKINQEPLTTLEHNELMQIMSNIEKEIFKQYPTVAKFCDEHGFNRTTLYEFLKLNNKPNLATLIKIKNALGVDLKDFIK